ncbi:Rieske (2Fe-2S) protein [Marinilabilia rubra]|uniref:Rieske domain-containing protein n=1 Tax=Marinilabilia rubra TaxID=2162893 RepID=A0A2U2BD59_9BACT|nr:Rieske 2Fe-2S domain-containing protein [Marinilabilia rubra]PWE00973.1 hypothetical protein DDZ16_00340 [Marinilabilia rubra]
MKRFVHPFAFILIIFALESCGDAVRDEFPKSRFIGYFNLNYPEYSKSVFTATRDMDGRRVGVNGLVIYNAGATYYAFDLMCPYEKEISCSVTVDIEEDPSIAECECCGSKFLIASPNGELIEGPARQSLHSYQTGVTQDNILVVSSN